MAVPSLLASTSATAWVARALAVVAGALLPLSLAPFGWWPLGILSAGLLLFLFEAQPTRTTSLGWCYALGKYALGASWVYVSIREHGNAGLPLAVFLVGVFVTGMALFGLTQGWTYGRLRQRAPGLNMANALLFVVLWVVWEWLLTWVLTGFPWLYLGNAHLTTWLGAWAPVGGVLLVSAAAVLSGTMLLYVVQRWVSREARLLSNSSYGIYAALLLLTLPWVGGWALMERTWVSLGAPKTVALVQNNIDQHRKWLPESRREIVQDQLRLTEPHWGKSLLVWPEAAVTYFAEQAATELEHLNRRAMASDSALVLGIPDRDQNGGFQNTVVALGTGQGRYVKRRLVPFGEYVPLEGLLRGLISFFDLPMSHASPGPDAQPLLKAGEETAAMAICYEIAYPALVQGDMPADVLLTISNDAWFGRSTGPEQHRQLAQLRALELGRWLLRATNTGHTVIVDHRGRVTQALPRFAEGVLTCPYQVRHGLTPFARIGQGPVLFAIVLALALVVFLRARFRPASAESPKP